MGATLDSAVLTGSRIDCAGDRQRGCSIANFITVIPRGIAMRYIAPTKVKVLMLMFFGTGIMGIIMGLVVAPPSATVIITFMGVLNFGLGAFFAYLFLTQEKKAPDKRKKKKRG